MKQFDLLIGMRSKIGVAAFGSDNAITPAIPNEERFAKTSACGEERAIIGGSKGSLNVAPAAA